MEYVTLGKSDLKVSRICLGCMGFGDAGKGQHSWTLGEEQSRAVIGAALDCGINFFDTAAAYQGGTCEEYVGRALRDAAKRGDYILATKFSVRSEREKAEGTDGARHVLNCLEGSLRRLGTDYVDLYICHMWDYGTPVEEIMRGLHEAVRQGKVRYAGISNCFAWQLQKANDIAERDGWQGFVTVQNHYNLLYREEEREMAACCADGGVAMTPYSPLASGRLVKPAEEMTKRLAEDAYAKSKYDKTAAQDAVIVDRVAEIAEARGMSRIQVALGWLLGKTAAPVTGATKASQITEAAKAAGVALTREETAYLEEPYVPHVPVGVMAENNGGKHMTVV